MSKHSTNALLLSIDEQHVNRIFAGEKAYELRKALPRSPFSRVFLHQTKGTGVVGCFELGGLIHEPVEELWKKVGAEATPRRRFESYFKGFTNGYALRVEDPRRFDRPLSAEALRRVYPQFTAPMSSMLLCMGHPLHSLLTEVRNYNDQARRLPVRLEPISQTAAKRFRHLVLAEIGSSYDGIDDSFVDAILETHHAGHDPVGFFTERKEALAIKGQRGKILGFSTITYKGGGSAKTGPTILEPEYRGEGVGQDVRLALEHRIIGQGFRKVYCTAPASKEGVLRYLLKSGYRVEAQLREQYTARHDELVFGKLLVSDDPELFLPLSHAAGASARAVQVSDLPPDFSPAPLASLLGRAWFPFGEESAKRIAEEITAPQESPTVKPKTGVLLMSGDAVVGVAILLPKRGGSVKTLLVAETIHTPSIERLLEAAVERSHQLEARRIYVLHPLGDVKTLGLLRLNAFLPEGLLIAPYRPGQDLAVYGRML